MSEQEYLQRIHELEKQIARLQTEIKKNSETQYGLRWMDVPEAFEAESENAIPILEEVKEKAISSDDGKPTHILIEGDNFHALTCLNYTHKGQIDVIYIDPPYNTGSDGFVYKDKRVLDKFPDGTTVPTDHPLRHSYWLSFMHKRLELAKNLLSERGVIFISIDDNEQANLKLLCDQVFGSKSFVATIIWETKREAKGIPPTTMSVTNHEYIMVYSNQGRYKFIGDLRNVEDGFVNPDNDPRGPYKRQQLQRFGMGFKEKTIVNPENGMEFTFETPYSLDKMNKWINEGIIVFPKTSSKYPIKKEYFSEYENPYKPIVTNFGLYSTKANSEKLKHLFGDEKVFDYSKPLDLMKDLLNRASHKTDIILDFFAGSGTTMHATMQLNEEDGGHRQCILVQQNENNICENVTYERNRRVMQGYTNAKGEQVAGLGNSMKYYKTAFVGEHDIRHISDADKVALTQRAGCLLALGENNLEEILTAKAYQIFQLRKGDKPTNDFTFTAVYFSGNLLHFADFRREIEKLQQEHPLSRIAVYVFTWGDPSIFENEFDDLSGITIKPIPQPILEIYQNINQL
ncbi:MAG: site-specific DNA-methyltransferase [Paludibacteraceae bacterium]|nr:site-specific DNA-methyltransferase [Paludibacteraceae bacterium]